VLPRARFCGAANLALVILKGALCRDLLFGEVVAAPQPPARSLYLRNLHTAETVDTVYCADGRCFPTELRRIDYVLRDFRENRVRPIDVSLLDLMVRIRQVVDPPAPFDVISGYRSANTNMMLAARSLGVSAHSMHVKGKAVDLRLAGCPRQRLWRATLGQNASGVGYYPQSSLVHLEVGRVRRWVFPSAAD